MTNLLFSLPYGIGFRNIVCCGIAQACLDRSASVTALLPTLSAADRRRIEEQLPANVEVRALMPPRHSASFMGLKLIKQHLYARRTGLESFRVKRDRRRRERPLLHAGASLLEMASERLCSEEWVDDRIARARQPYEDYYLRLLDERRIDVVILAKPGYQPEDLALIKAARLRGRPTIAIDTTWDNIVSKRPTYLAPDALSAWSQRMKDEAIRFYRLGADKVPVTGGAAFDVFFRREQLAPRTAFLDSLGLDASKPLIVFTLNNPIFNPQNARYIEFLLEAVKRGQIRQTPNVVVRMHPWDRNSNHERLVASYSRVHLERPFGAPDASSVYECIPSGAEVLHYGALMAHADVVVNIGSTTSLDAIAADTPVVNIAFDIDPVPRELSAARFYDYTHYRPIVESGAVRLVDTPEEFIEAVNAYLGDPGLDGDRRAAARRQFLTFEDGLSATRVASAILELN